eukprot:1130220-Rhodomonas_salina.1
MLALAASNGWFTNSTDVTLSFINAPIETQVYVRPPKDMEEPYGQATTADNCVFSIKRGADELHVM